MFAVDAEYLYYDLSLRPSVSRQGLPDASGHLQSVSLDGIVNVPRHIGRFGVYGIFGFGFDDRGVSAHSELLTNGSVCQQAYYRWWGINCTDLNPGSPRRSTGIKPCPPIRRLRVVITTAGESRINCNPGTMPRSTPNTATTTRIKATPRRSYFQFRWGCAGKK